MLGREVLGIRKLQGVNLDRDYVTEWAQRLGVVDALTQTLTLGRTLNKYSTSGYYNTSDSFRAERVSEPITGYIVDYFFNRPLAKITRTGKMPIPQKTFFLVERASCPFQNLIKRTFARGLMFKSSAKLPKMG
ncbi:hypothetical protein [Microcoleus sp. Pol11C3]|uniref:hypothetical protein n=1 Tax=Microcoleus sp. Pol11C3 TaxID=3055390 RepID=UPI002FD64C6D